MVSALVPGSSGPGSSPGRGTFVFCSWARHFTLTVPNCWGVTCDGLASRPGGVEILLAASCYGNQDKLWPDEPVLAPKASRFSLFYGLLLYCFPVEFFDHERSCFRNPC